MKRKEHKPKSLVSMAKQFRGIEEEYPLAFDMLSTRMCPTDFYLDDGFVGNECGTLQNFERCRKCWHRALMNVSKKFAGKGKGRTGL